ncbi:MAG: SMI1/KNR4 family protein [Bacteroidales bacterium]|nr:SMI1/KNR4 family protein [Bacteroidales bacterium]
MICTDNQIRSLENQYNVKLPKTYIEFLKGKYPEIDPLLVGSDFEYRYLKELKKWANELLKENGNPFELKENDYVFLMHQGYQFMYFSCGDQLDDPPVYYYREGELEKERKFERFTEWIELLKNEVEQAHLQ